MTIVPSSSAPRKTAQAAEPAPTAGVRAAAPGLVGALLGAGLLGGERLLNAKNDPHSSKDAAARRRREVLKRALLGGLIGGVGGTAYGYRRQLGDLVASRPADPARPGNVIPAVPSTLIGAIIGAGALGGGRAITRAMDPSEGEDLEEGGDSVWRSALLGAGLGGAAGYGLSWNTRPGGLLGPAKDVPVADAAPAAGVAPTGDTVPAAVAPKGVDPIGPNDLLTGALRGTVGAKLAPSALRVTSGIWDGIRSVKATPVDLERILSEARNAGKAVGPASQTFLDTIKSERAHGVKPDNAEILRSLAHGRAATGLRPAVPAIPDAPAKVTAEASIYRPGRTLSPHGKLVSTLSNIWRDIMPEKIAPGGTTKRVHAGYALPAFAGVLGALWGAGNGNAIDAAQEKMQQLRGSQ